MRTSATTLVLSLVLCGAARASDPVPAGGVPDFVGARGLALGASIGLASGNEGLYVNPGAIAARRRYEVDAGALLDRRGADNAGRYFGGSIVDSESSPMSAGFSYVRAQKGIHTGDVITVALAGSAAEGFFVGASGKYLSLSGKSIAVPTADGTRPVDVSAVTADAGLLWQVTRLVSVGMAGYNLVPISNKLVAPLGMGVGVAVGNDRTFQVTGDWRADLDAPGGGTASRWSGGAEALLFDVLAVRAGVMKDGVLDTTWWSAGVGLVSASGAVLDFGYRQSIDDSSARMLGLTLKLFVNIPR